MQTATISEPRGNLGHANSRITRRSLLRVPATAGAGAIAQAMLAAGQAQESAISDRPRFGVNYIPRKNWLYSWQDWSTQSVAEDFQAIRSLGTDHVRVQCLWSLFQPGPSYVSERMLEQLGSLLDQAEKAELDVEITVLNGWMSGLAFLPAWTAPVAKSKGSLYVDADVIEAEKLLFRRLAETVSARRRFLGFDLGNEMNVLLSRGNPATEPQARAWSSDMFRYVESVAPGKFFGTREK